MGFFDFLSGSKEEQTQLHFRDGMSFQFRKLPFKDSCLVEEKDNIIVKAWKHFYSSEMRFDGYRSISADKVTLSFDRDFILDPFNRIPTQNDPNLGKPKADENSIKTWTAKVAESQRYKVMNKPGNTLLLNKITMWLGIALIIELLIFGATVAIRTLND